MKELLDKILKFALGPIGSAFIGLITVPITTYFVDPYELGRASMFTLVTALMSSFLFLGLDQAYTREFNSYEDKNQLFFNALIFPLVLSVFVFLFFIINASSISNVMFGQTNYLMAVYITGSMSILLVFERFMMLRLRMEERALEYSMRAILVKFLILLATIVSVTMIRRDFMAVLFSTAFGQIVGNGILIIKHRTFLNFKTLKLDKSLQKRLWSFGFPIIFSAFLTSFLTMFDRFSLRTWSDFEQLGLYTAAMKIIAILTIIKSIFSTAWVPIAYRWHEEGKEMKYYQLVSEALLAIMSLGFVLLLIFRSLIVLLLSSEYHSTIYFIGFLSLQPLLYTLSETTTLGIVYSRKTYLNIWVSMFSAITSLLLNVLLVPSFGALGAAFSLSMAFVCFFFARTYFSFKEWGGFSIKKHTITIIAMIILAGFNSLDFSFIQMINISALIGVLIINKSIWRLACGEILKFIRNKKSNT